VLKNIAKKRLRSTRQPPQSRQPINTIPSSLLLRIISLNSTLLLL